MKTSLKLFGVGNAGVCILEALPKTELADARFVAVNTDAKSLANSTAAEKIELDKKMLAKSGPGHTSATEAQLAAVRESCQGASTVIVIAGLGGRAGSQIGAAIAKAAKEAGAHVLAFVTLPLDCEGSLRFSAARHALAHFHDLADAVFCLPNQEACALSDETTNLTNAFNAPSELIATTILNVCRALGATHVMGLEFHDLCALTWLHRAQCSFAVAEAIGDKRATEAVERLLAQPTLHGGKALAGAETVMVSVVGGADLRVAEVNQIMKQIGKHCPGASHVMGAGIAAGFAGLSVLLVAAGGRATDAEHDEEASAAQKETAQFETDFLPREQKPRPRSRVVPPPPSLTQEQRHQFLDQQTSAGRVRRKQPRMRQEQLPLEIVSKGRFDKTEPTVRGGEDLDIPTFIRRGVALN